MRGGTAWAVAVVATATAALGLASCAHQDDVSYLGPPRPSRGPNCELQVFLSKAPPYPLVEIGSTRARCSDFSGGRAGCMGLIRQQACEAGADTVFGFSESVDNLERTYMSATLAVRTGGAPVPASVPPPVAPAPGVVVDDGTCAPICSPGFACAAGQCLPQCNPTCLAGEVCTRKRICEPSAATAAPAPPPAVPGAAPASATPAAAAKSQPTTGTPQYAPAWPPPAASKPAQPTAPPRPRAFAE